MAKPARFPKRIEGGSRLRRFQGLGTPIVPSIQDENIHAVLMKKHAADAIVIGEDSTGDIRDLLASLYRLKGLFTQEIAEIIDIRPRPPQCLACSDAHDNDDPDDDGFLSGVFIGGLTIGGIRRIAQILAFVNRMRFRYAREFREGVARARVTQIEKSVDDTNRRRWNANILSTAKSDPVVPDVMGRIIVRRNPQPGDAVKSNWTQRNIDLLKTDIDNPALQQKRVISVPDFYFDKYERILTEGLRKERRVENIVEELQQLTGQTLRRSDALARDEISAHNSNLEQRRSTEAGITHFLWVSRRDARVRLLHTQRDSKLYSYDHKFSDGAPGIPPRCRCQAQPSLRRSRADPEDFRELIPVSHPRRKLGETPPEFLERNKFSAPIQVNSNRPALIPRLVGRDIVFGDPLAGTAFPRPRLRTKK